MSDNHSREIKFESINNFRDLGGYRTIDGHTVSWRKLFRSGDITGATPEDLRKLREQFGLVSVVNLRSDIEINRSGLGLIPDSGIRFYHVSLIPDVGDKNARTERYRDLNNMGEFFVRMAHREQFGRRLVQALETIADPANHPLIFHCSEGKDRTGIVAAMVLRLLGVADEDIVGDYCLSAPFFEERFKRMKNDPQFAQDSYGLPDFFWQVAPDSMKLLLDTLDAEYGSAGQYLEMHGAAPSLGLRLKDVLLDNK